MSRRKKYDRTENGIFEEGLVLLLDASLEFFQIKRFEIGHIFCFALLQFIECPFHLACSRTSQFRIVFRIPVLPEFGNFACSVSEKDKWFVFHITGIVKYIGT